MERFIAAGLYNPDSPNAAERRELIEHLLARGFTAEQICATAATHYGPFTDMAATLSHEPVEWLSAAECAERSGVSVEEIAEVRATLGLPLSDLDAREIAATFLEDLLLYQVGCASFGRERTLGFVRVIGAATAALMEAARELVLTPLGESSATELEVSQANEFGVAAWAQTAATVQHVMWERMRHSVWFAQDLVRGPIAVAVSFVDLVGSTDWTSRVSAHDQAGALDRFEHAAVRIASAHGARVVKFIGDEAMIVGNDAAAVAEVAARLCAAADDDSTMPSARGAVGWGVVTPRGGDFFGDVVNLVARATKEAAPGGVVVTPEAAAHLPRARWRLGVPRPVELRGVSGAVELVDAVLDL